MASRLLPKQMATILGLDYGAARIGCAVSDADERIALPAGTIAVPAKDVLPTIAAMAQDRSVSRLVVGLPIGMNGKKTAQTAVVQAFIRRLEDALALPVETVDERLTSVQAARSKGVGSVDERSAVLLLQAFLDARKGD